MLPRASVSSCRTFVWGLCALLVLTATPSDAVTVEYFTQGVFVAGSPGLTVIGFDALAPGDGALAGTEFVGQGMTIVQRDGLPMNVVQNTVPGGFGGNFATQGNFNSAPNGISSSLFVSTASAALSDNFDFIFATNMFAAGLSIGNLGGGFDATLGSTTVQFLDALNVVIASEVLDKNHVGVIFGPLAASPTSAQFDNRIFYGVTSDAGIRKIRVINGTNDSDGIVLDDVSFAVPSQVPEPGSLWTVTLGLVLFAAGARRPTPRNAAGPEPSRRPPR